MQNLIDVWACFNDYRLITIVTAATLCPLADCLMGRPSLHLNGLDNHVIWPFYFPEHYTDEVSIVN